MCQLLLNSWTRSRPWDNEFAFKGGLSFSLGDIIIPAEKHDMIADANQEVDGIMMNYNMGLITNNERYNQVIDVWTSTNAMLTELAMKRIREDQQGFNSVYMMLDSGARGSKEQIRQLTGMRGLMAKLRNPLRVVVRLLRTRFFLTLRKVCRFSNTLSLRTVREKDLRIQHLKLLMRVTLLVDLLMFPRM